MKRTTISLMIIFIIFNLSIQIQSKKRNKITKKVIEDIHSKVKNHFKHDNYTKIKITHKNEHKDVLKESSLVRKLKEDSPLKENENDKENDEEEKGNKIYFY